MRVNAGRTYSPEEIRIMFPKNTHVFRKEQIRGFSVDSREIRPGDAFFMLRGEHGDGKDYEKEAIAKGAVLSVSDNDGKLLLSLASARKNEVSPHTVAVTGSVGKTGTKDMVAAVLATEFRVHKTEGNYNSEVGLAMTLLSLPDNTDWLVAEMGMRGQGEISELSRIAAPDIGIITAIGTSHIGLLGSIDAIANAKWEIADGMKTGGKIYIGNTVIPKTIAGIQTIAVRERDGIPSVFSVFPTANGCRFSLCTEKRTYSDVVLPLYGTHNAKNAAFAVLIGEYAGVSEEKMRSALAGIRSPIMRSELIHRDGIYVLYDCYNASPESVTAAGETLRHMLGFHPGARAYVLLGDMHELGDNAEELHYKVGMEIGNHPFSGIFAVGEHAKALLAGAESSGFSGLLSENPFLLSEHLQKGDLLLIKASHAENFAEKSEIWLKTFRERMQNETL